VLTARSFEEVSSYCSQEGHSKVFDLIFIGLDLAIGGIDNLSVIESLRKQSRFVVMFPVFQQDETLRVLFKAGVYDCVDKPYEREGLLRLVEGELNMARMRTARMRMARMRQMAPQNERKRSDLGMLLFGERPKLGKVAHESEK